MDELADVRQALARPPHQLDDPTLRRAAVAAILGPGRRLWFVRRVDRPGDPWSGHVAFPGGHHEPDDGDLLTTAIRETREELGVDLGDAELLGQLDDLRTRPVRTMMVRPYVFRVDRPPTFAPNREIAHVFARPLDDLLAGAGRASFQWPLDGVGFVTLPAVHFEGDGRLWGLTLQMVDDLLHRIDGRGLGLARAR